MSTAGKIVLAISVPTVALAGYYIIDRVAIKQAPLFPFSLDKAREKQANAAMKIAEKKLETLMKENKINGFGTMQDPQTKKFYIEVGAQNPTTELRNQIPLKVSGIEIRLVQREMAKALS